MDNVGFDGKDRSEVEDNTRKRFRLGLALFALYLIYWIAIWKLAPSIIVAQVYFPFAYLTGAGRSPVTVGFVEALPLIVTLAALQFLGVLQRNVLSWLVWLSISGLLSYAAYLAVEISGP